KFDLSQKTEKAGATEYIILLTWPKNVNAGKVTTHLSSISLLRNLINTPANLLGTEELANTALTLAKKHKAKTNVIKGKALEEGFPLIHEVGKASPRQPQLVEFTWGKSSDPAVTIVGKGIIYDTGGLNLKPGMYMRDMKKDMGGAAHALGLASMIISQKLPVQLRVLIPIAENAVAGNPYRPGDVLTSRKGITVEIGDTDAEGRLVVADAIYYACEDKKPDLLVDYCTLTGAARVALGYDIPAFFSNSEEIIDNLRKSSVTSEDPVWPLPLWHGYKKELSSTVADMTNDGSGRAGAIHGALFLDPFVKEGIDWLHLDCYAWEQHGKPGRPKGGADTGMRAVFDYIENRYTR
ncbi:MAG: leucyl aminopeptidase family protein, partial [Pseudomonadota bacterium]